VGINSKAYEATAYIWWWAPTDERYWIEISADLCYDETECNLNISLHSGGSVRVDTIPGGTIETYDSSGATPEVTLPYPCGTQITVTAIPKTGYFFQHWLKGADTVYTPVMNITVQDSTTAIEPAFIPGPFYDLSVRMAAGGSIAVEYCPDDSVRTFNRGVDSVITLAYPESAQVRLIAIPEDDRIFVNWGDAGSTTTKAITLTIVQNTTLTPQFQTGTTGYAAPKNCQATQNMAAGGRSRLFGELQLLDGADISGPVTIMKKHSPGEKITLFHDSIGTGNTQLLAGSARSPFIWAHAIQTDDMETDSMPSIDVLESEHIRVTADTFPDYVFRPDYPLQSLDELAAFVSSNGHLPNVPTEKEIKLRGIDLAAMGTVMTEKIEELMLHIIQLNKRVEAIQNKKSE
jgi:hypothetical protein